jgi:hypothetical protein
MTKGLSFAVLLLLLQLLLRIEAAKRGKEKERLTWSCYLKTKTMVMEGWLTNVTFFPDASVFRSLHLCSCFSLLVFSRSLCLSLFLFLWVSLCIICVCSFFVCVFFVLSVCGSPLLYGFSLFVLVSLGLYLVGWINNLRWGDVEVPFCWRKSIHVWKTKFQSNSYFFFKVWIWLRIKFESG